MNAERSPRSMSAREESEQLMTGDRVKRKPDWTRFGLSAEQQKESDKHYESTIDTADGSYHGDPGQQNEIFREDQVSWGLIIGERDQYCVRSAGNVKPWSETIWCRSLQLNGHEILVLVLILCSF